MSVLWMENFSMYDPGPVNKSAPWLLATGWTRDSFSHAHSYLGVPTGGRTEGYLTANYGNVAICKWVDQQDVMIVGFAYRAIEAAVYDLISFNHNDGFNVTDREVMVGRNLLGQMYVKLNGTILMDHLSPEDVMRPATWDYVEVKVKSNTNGTENPNGYVIVRVNRIEYINIQNIDTVQKDPSRLLSEVCFYVEDGERLTDIYIANDQGAVNNDFLGDVRIRTILPTGPGDLTEWDPTGAVNNWDNVNEPGKHDDGDYNSTTTDQAVDLYHYSDLPVNVTEVFAVAPWFRARKDDAGFGSLKYTVKENGVTHESPDVVMASTYQNNQYIMELRPDGTPWDKASLEAAQFGVTAKTIGA